MTSSTLSELAELLDAVLVGDGSRVVNGAAPLLEAESDEVSFLVDERYKKDLAKTSAVAVLVTRELADALAEAPVSEGPNLLVCSDPGRAFSAVVEHFALPVPPVEPGVHPTAVIDAEAVLGEGVSVGAHCVVGPGARLADGVVLHPRVVVGAGAQVGARSVLFPGVVLYPHVRMGADCTIHANSVLGADGFGFLMTERGWEKVPQGGLVELGDGVEIGACTAIDRARTGATRIGAGTKIDNLVHVAHNVKIGEQCLLAGQAGVAGSTRMGKRVVIGGQAGIIGHVELGDGVGVGAQAGVSRSIEPGQQVTGYHALPVRDELKQVAHLRRLGELFQTVKDLKKRLEELEGSSS